MLPYLSRHARQSSPALTSFFGSSGSAVYSFFALGNLGSIPAINVWEIADRAISRALGSEIGDVDRNGFVQLDCRCVSACQNSIDFLGARHILQQEFGKSHSILHTNTTVAICSDIIGK